MEDENINLELSKKDKILILSKAMSYIHSEIVRYNNGEIFGTYGICYAISLKIRKTFPVRGGFLRHTYDIELFIPEFTLENAVRLNFKYNFKSPLIENAFWWNRDDFENRISFLKALIKEIEKS